MLLQLKRSPEREAAMQRYIDELHDASSANFHKWLTPDEFAVSYGVASADVETVTRLAQIAWIHGSTVLPASGLTIDFSGYGRSGS